MFFKVLENSNVFTLYVCVNRLYALRNWKEIKITTNTPLTLDETKTGVVI